MRSITVTSDVARANGGMCPARLTRVVHSLLDNAVRHARARVTVTAASDGTTARIRVADDGPGISPEIASNLFERFEFGMLKRRVGAEDASPIVLPDLMIGNQIQYYVPIDDTHTWSVTCKAHHLPPGLEMPKQEVVPWRPGNG